MTTLDDAQDVYDVPDDPDERGAFTVDSVDKAAWAMRRYVRVVEQINTIADQALVERRRIDEWEAKVTEPLHRDRDFFESLLRNYALAERAEGRKSTILPNGKVTTRAGSWRIDVQDKEQLLAWARSNDPELIRVTVTESVNVDVLKRKYADMELPSDVDTDAHGASEELTHPDSGELIPGVIARLSRTSATITPTS